MSPKSEPQPREIIVWFIVGVLVTGAALAGAGWLIYLHRGLLR